MNCLVDFIINCVFLKVFFEYRIMSIGCFYFRYCFIIFLVICSYGLRGVFIIIGFLKVVFFYVCEEFLLNCWFLSIGFCLFYLLIFFVIYIENKCIFCYFIFSNNIIDYWFLD